MPDPTQLPRLDAFALPRGIYLDGNSLGPLPLAAQNAIERRVRQWQHHAVTAWDDWFGLAERLAPALARLVGAHADEVVPTGSITVNLHQLLATLYRPEGDRRDLLATALDFPTDVHALRTWAERSGGRLRFVPSRDGHTVDEGDVEDALGSGGVALMLMPSVLYRSGQALDVRRLTSAAHAAGAIAIWDAAHSIGAMPHALHDDGVDAAVWCSYKYLNAGPGAPGGLFLHRRHHQLAPGLQGWWGSDKGTQFAMDHTFTKADGAGGLQLGTPSILGLAGLEGALAVFEEVGIERIRARSLELTEALLAAVDAQLPEFKTVTPREAARRGGHVALAHPEARRITLALRERGVIADHRPPDVLRLAPVALYTTDADISHAVARVRDVLDTGAHLAVGAGGLVT
ncbi:kynureninase [soil metagenome]|nr:kynureninase [Trueperaceae bacterium]